MKISWNFRMTILKYLTPNLFQQIHALQLDKKPKKRTNIKKIPRPFTLFLKHYFGNKKITGVEIGVMRGKNSRSLLKELNIEKLYLIDCWDIDNKSYGKSQENYHHVKQLFRFDSKIEIFKGYSNRMVHRLENNSVDFCYIDGNHSYPYVLQDIDLYYSKVKKGGIIGGHDIFNCMDVFYAVRDWCNVHNKKYIIHNPDWWFIV